MTRRYYWEVSYWQPGTRDDLTVRLAVCHDVQALSAVVAALAVSMPDSERRILIERHVVLPDSA